MSQQRTLKLSLQALILFLVFQYLVGPSTRYFIDIKDQVRVYTGKDEFDFLSWTWNALGVKAAQAALNPADYLDEEAQRTQVLDYFALIYHIQTGEAQLAQIYTDPSIVDKDSAAAEVRARLQQLYEQRGAQGPLAESILQYMVADITAQMGFTVGGQPLPPVLYHATPLPWALIVSPRDTIQQEANISLKTELNLDQHIQLEDKIADALDVSTLVVPVGGIGVYPTMVKESIDQVWITTVISHEWIHNYLTLRPLGALYEHTPALRTMNETAASLAGDEIGLALIAKFFPELSPPPPPPPSSESEDEALEAPPPPEEAAFDYRAEMHETRVTVDALLAESKIEEAETYMESRRQHLWDNGYPIRKLNQAFFAFHGAYADVPGGAAGEDPVGAAVRQLRAQSDSLVDFINTISWFTSFEALEEFVQSHSSP